MRPATFVSILALIAAGVAMVFVTRGVSIPILQPMGPIAFAERRVILVTFALASFVVIPVFFLLFYFAWKYRMTSPHAPVHHRPNWDHDNATIEFIWWLVPSAIIAVLAVITWQGSHTLDPYVPLVGKNTLEVRVVALNWKWLFIYPKQGIATINELMIPVGVPVHFSLTADAPMNSMWIPSLGGQIMVMPGMETQLNLSANVPGTFDGFSGNLSGTGFARMTFKVHSLTQDQFDAWVDSVKASSALPLDAVSYARLSKPSEANPVSYYFPVQDDLYTSIYMKFMPAMQGAHMPASMMHTPRL